FFPGQQQQQQQRGNQAIQALQQQQQALAGSSAGGPVMVVDMARNVIIYSGTKSQQAQLKSLIAKFDTDQEIVTIETYKIKNQLAQDIADVLQGVTTGQNGPDTSNPFLPGGGGFFNNLQRQFQNQNQSTPQRSTSTRSSSTNQAGGRTTPTSTQRQTGTTGQQQRG